MKKLLQRLCLILTIVSCLVFIGIWIIAIWFDGVSSMDWILKINATSFVIGLASVCGYIFLYEQAEEKDFRDKNLSN